MELNFWLALRFCCCIQMYPSHLWGRSLWWRCGTGRPKHLSNCVMRHWFVTILDLWNCGVLRFDAFWWFRLCLVLAWQVFQEFWWTTLAYFILDSRQRSCHFPWALHESVSWLETSNALSFDGDMDRWVCMKYLARILNWRHCGVELQASKLWS